MKTIKTKIASFIATAAVATGLLASAPVAQAVTVTLGGDTTFVVGSGYGSGDLLGVIFTDAITQAANLTFANIGDKQNITLGTVQLNEQGNNISASSLSGDLSVAWSFAFTAPGTSTQEVTATATGYSGNISDSDVDFSVTWPQALSISLDQYVFSLALSNLSFTKNSSYNEVATLTYVSGPINSGNIAPPVTDVPEPASLALLGLGLAGLGVIRRRKA